MFLIQLRKKQVKKRSKQVINKEMSSIYLKVTNETFSKLRFPGFKNFSPGHFWGASTQADIIEF